MEYTSSSFWEEKKRKKTDTYSHGPGRSKKWVIDKSFSIDCCDCNEKNIRQQMLMTASF